MATTTERLELLITAKVNDAVDGLKQAEGSVGGVSGKMDALDAKMAPLNGKLQSLGLSGVSSGAMISAGAAVGVGALAGLIALAGDSVDEFLTLSDTIRDFQRVTGLGADESSRLVAIFDDLEVDMEPASRAFFKLGREIGTGDSNLQSFGVTVARDKDGRVDLVETMLRIADAYKGTNDQGERAALLQEAFGRGGKELIPILENGRAKLEEMWDAVPEGQIFDQGQIDSARQYQLAMDDLADSFQEIKTGIGSAIAPGLAEFATGLATIVRTTNEAAQAVGGMDKVFGAGFGAIIESAPIIGPTVGLVKDLGGAFGLGGQKSDEFADAQKRLADAQKRVTELAVDETASHKDLREAKKELSAAQEDLEGKTKAVVNAMKDENDKTRESIALADQKIGGILGVYGADLQYQQALEDHATKQETLTRLEAEGKTGTEEYETAKRALEQSDLALVQSGLSLESQIRALKDQVDSGKLSTEEYQARVEELRAKYPELGGALDTITGKVREHTGAINEVPEAKHTWLTADTSQAEDAIGRLRQAIQNLPRTVVTSFQGWLSGEGRASGGPVSAGWTGWVGEQGPELVSFSRPAHVFSHRDSMAMVGGASSGASNSYAISVNVAPGGNPAEVGRAVVESIKQYERRAGTSWRN